jgi:hypothetical protein
MKILFEVNDKTSRNLRMTIWNWEHVIRRHPEISSEKDKIIETLQSPDKIIPSLRDENARFYYKHYKHRQSINKFMMVLVK